MDSVILHTSRRRSTLKEAKGINFSRAPREKHVLNASTKGSRENFIP
jgi:hypothetical protein